ncbi:quinol dehydrogenase ferredoxin subunit NapH [Neiella marina]|uniref:Quinol dehydrogenase ferredoxin subunit NapH n=1 Tax=Neiella holothuriorum TaxID=2870530 RepID=A0ABS7EF38_9GAMM|nr:quinol dehydrogenase ferredoxin subunit NapH [Neiella holothuriorum]MBW8190967.1 quinol dehydrogenase ferredoxin subunit NapH [Neiella holothuriorum]
MKAQVGLDAVARFGWMRAHRFLLLRRLMQLSVMGLFLLGPWFDVWLIRGNLSSSELLGAIPFTEPWMLLQSLVSGYWPQATLLLGAGIVIAIYWLIGGRSYCSWVCPMNVVTDTAHWLRRQLKVRSQITMPSSIRWGVVAGALLATAFVQGLVWELINPVSLLHRGILFGLGAGWLLIVAVFLFDVFVVEKGWCSQLCPMGACYGLIGRISPVKVVANRREDCNQCMDCYVVCPEPHILKAPLREMKQGSSPLVSAQDCTRCLRCIDVCGQDVFDVTASLKTNNSIQPVATGNRPRTKVENNK